MGAAAWWTLFLPHHLGPELEHAHAHRVLEVPALDPAQIDQVLEDPVDGRAGHVREPGDLRQCERLPVEGAQHRGNPVDHGGGRLNGLHPFTSSELQFLPTWQKLTAIMLR